MTTQAKHNNKDPIKPLIKYNLLIVIDILRNIEKIQDLKMIHKI